MWGRIIVIALSTGLSIGSMHAQSPTLASLADKFVAANEAERVEMADAHPEFRELPFREAITVPGNTALRRGDFALAEHYQKAVLWLGNHFDDDVLRAVAFVNLASVNGQRGDFVTAQRYAIDGIRLSERVNDLHSVQVASSNLGIIQRRLGDIDASLQTFDRALRLAEQLNLPDNAARVVNNMGMAYADFGNMAMARDFFDRSLAMKEKLGTSIEVSQDIARTLNNIGTLYEQQGDYQQALDHFQRSRKLLEHDSSPSLSSSISNIGHVYLNMGDLGRAREQFNQALALAESQGDRPRLATILYLLGYLDRASGAYAQAEATQRRALTIREETGEAMPLVESLTELSNLILHRDAPAEAYAMASRAVNIASVARLSSRFWKAQQAAADALAALKRDDEAISLYQAGIEGIETLRQMTVGGSRGQQQYLGQRHGPYYGLARLHARAGRPFDALLAVERARARTLLDVLAGGRQATRMLTTEQKQRERDLTQAVLSVSVEIDSLQGRRKFDPAELAVLEAKLSRARLERDVFTTELYKTAPDFRIARGDAPVITRDQLNALVKPGTAFISLVLDNTEVWAYVVTRTNGAVTVNARLVPMSTPDLVKKAGEFAKQVATRDLGFSTNARALYDLLFVATKIEPLLNGKSQIVIIPDGPLWHMPFQALQTPRDTFLIEERAVAYAPSVSALAALERRRQSRDNREPYLVALGDPEVAAGTAVTNGRKVLGRLPQAAREVTALGQLYGNAKSRVLVGDQATEGALRDNIARATVVHVATHGVLDDLSPMYSHLMLAKTAGKTSESDGRLEAWELMDRPLNVDLAVLSACETARGPVGDGEGVIGLSWSLFAAGASTAVVSQWEVDSASTTALMIAFHERLLLSPRNDSKVVAAPEALRVAAMRLMRGPAYRHPFYWAGFVVIGAS